MARNSASYSPAPGSFRNANCSLHPVWDGTYHGDCLGSGRDSHPQTIAGFLPDGRVVVLLSDWLGVSERDCVRAVDSEARAQGSLSGAGCTGHQLCVNPGGAPVRGEQVSRLATNLETDLRGDFQRLHCSVFFQCAGSRIKSGRDDVSPGRGCKVISSAWVSENNEENIRQN